MKIYLIKPLTEEQASLLSSINVTVSARYLDVPDTGSTYCRASGDQYQIYCNDEPIAFIYVKDELWDSDQIVNIQKERIAIAKEKLANNTVSKSTSDYEERCRKVSAGDNSCLFETPFSDLRPDEQKTVRKTGYQREDSEKFYPLSQSGLTIVSLIKETKSQLDFIRYNGAFFAGREREQKAAWEGHRETWNNLLEGKHELTSGMKAEQIQAYFNIAKGEKVSPDFQEISNAVSDTALRRKL